MTQSIAIGSVVVCIYMCLCVVGSAMLLCSESDNETVVANRLLGFCILKDNRCVSYRFEKQNFELLISTYMV